MMDKNAQCELLASTHTYMHTLTHMHTHVQTHNTHTRIYNVKIQSVEQIGSGGYQQEGESGGSALETRALVGGLLCFDWSSCPEH